MNHARKKRDWSVFDGFVRPQPRVSWATVRELVDMGKSYAASRCSEFPDLLERWNRILQDCDGDPCRTDWSAFRPLRREREEDWSDWLQHFIATSKTGCFSQHLFRRNTFADPLQATARDVQREDALDGRRADLVITWKDASRTHLEVKVGDRSVAKTVDTAAKLEKKYAASAWSHYLLLPSQDAQLWNAEGHDGASAVHVITWDDVAVALRRALRSKEGRRWLMWAHGFCGIVEQELLGHPLEGDTLDSVSLVARRLRQIAVMKEGLNDG